MQKISKGRLFAAYLLLSFVSAIILAFIGEAHYAMRTVSSQKDGPFQKIIHLYREMLARFFNLTPPYSETFTISSLVLINIIIALSIYSLFTLILGEKNMFVFFLGNI